MAKPRSNMRLFVAIHPPPSEAADMLEAVSTQRGLPPHRVTPVGQVHLTLQFIGDTPVADLEATIESVERSAAGIGAFALEPLRLIALPERGPSRLIAMETSAPAPLMELQRRLAHRLAHQPRGGRDQRFRPHLTLCRFRSPASLRVALNDAVEVGPFAVSEIRLMRSTLDSEGAAHHEVKCVDL